MDREAAAFGIVLALTLVASSAAADSLPVEIPPDAETTLEAYRQRQRDLFDARRADPSPRSQVLASRLSVDDESVPTTRRPKREDVVASAARFARGDAVVPWIAADAGSYYGGRCGPTRWADAEVATLVAREPAKAGALQYAAALAHAKGDQDALDDTLVRMAAAARADDHAGDEIAQWRKVHRDAERKADDRLATRREIEALRLALERAGKAEPPADWASPAERRAANGT